MTEVGICLLIGYAAMFYIGFETRGFMARKSEETSKEVARMASAFLKNSEIALQNLKGAVELMEAVIANGKSVAASALTQAPDKKKK